MTDDPDIRVSVIEGPLWLRVAKDMWQLSDEDIARMQLDRLTNAMVEDILSMTDEEVIAELKEEGMSEGEIKAVADKMRLKFEEVAAAAQGEGG